MTDESLIPSLVALEAELKDRESCRWYRYFADDGPYDRRRYPKHMAFFAAGATYRQRMFLAGNRCLTARTMVPTSGGLQAVGDLYERGTPFRVWTRHHGHLCMAEADAPYRLPRRAECVRLTMQDGQWVEGAVGHRIWTPDGWQPLSRWLPQPGEGRQESTGASGQSIPHEDGPRSSETARGFQGHYWSGRRRDDEQPRVGQETAQASPPSPADARQRRGGGWHEGVLGSSDTSTARSSCAHQASLDVQIQREALCVACAIRTDDTNARRWCDSARDARPSRVASRHRPRSSVEQARQAAGIAPSSRPSAWCEASNSIIRIEPIGVHEVFDFTVPSTGCYLAGDLLHHNTGKSDAAAYELTCHLTGLYPHWWVGKRFDTPIEAWASGDTANTTRNILQVAFLGPILTVESKQWCGMIPRRLIYDVTRKQGIPSAIQTIWVRHTTGGISTLDLLSYDQKREAFQGTAKHIILLDEEPPADIYAECLIRTMTTGGSVIVTMTPLMGLTPFVSEWLERSVLEVLGPDGTSELQQAKSAVFGRENG